MPVAFQHFSQRQGDFRIVIDDQQPQRSGLRQRFRLFRARGRGRVAAHRQFGRECGASSRRVFQHDRAAVSGDDIVDQRQPDTGAEACRLGREERIEDAAFYVVRHAWTIIRHRQADRSRVMIGSGCYGYPARSGGCLKRLLGVYHKVGHDLIQLVGIGPQVR
jgi:hypothetical protein